MPDKAIKIGSNGLYQEVAVTVPSDLVFGTTAGTYAQGNDTRIKQLITNNLTFYVDAALGNDNNAGTSSGAGAFQTFRKVLDVIASYDLNRNPLRYTLTFFFAAGTYGTGSWVELPSSVNQYNNIRLIGNTDAPTNVAISDVITCSAPAWYSISGINFTGTSSYQHEFYQSYIAFINCQFSIGVFSGQGNYVSITDSTFSGNLGSVPIQASSSGYFYVSGTITFINSANTGGATAVAADGTSRISLAFATFTGSLTSGTKVTTFDKAYIDASTFTEATLPGTGAVNINDDSSVKFSDGIRTPFFTSLGDTLYAGTNGALTRLPGNTTTTPNFFKQTGNGSISAAPVWSPITKTDVGLSNVINLDTSNPANITQSASYRFVTDAEKTTWNGKISLTSLSASTPISYNNSTGAFSITDGAITYAKLQNISATQRVLGRNTVGAGVTEEVSASQILDWLGSTQGQIVYRGASGWAVLPPGTSGQALITGGSAANPSWGTVASGGVTVTTASSNATLTLVAGVNVILCNTTGGSFTLTLPSSPPANTTVIFVDAAVVNGNTGGFNTNTLVIAPATGQKILGYATNDTFTCDIAGSAIELTLSGTTWVATSGFNPTNFTNGPAITLTGDVTGSGTGSFAATIANGAVTLAKQADVATGTVFYRKTTGTGSPEVQTLATLKADLAITPADITGLITGTTVSTVTFTGTQNDLSVADSVALLRWNGASSAVLTGITATTINGRWLRIRNVTSGQVLVLAHGNSGSSAANQFDFSGRIRAHHIVLFPGEQAVLAYNTPTSLWQDVSFSEHWFNSFLRPSTGTTVIVSGMQHTSYGGTISTQTWASTSFATRALRVRGATGTTSSSVAGTRSNGIVGLNSGFHGRWRWNMAAWAVGANGFVGFSANTFTSANPPTSFLNTAGFGFGDAATVWQVFSNDNSGTASPTSLGSNFPIDTTSVFEGHLWAASGSSSILYCISRLDDLTILPAVGVLSGDIPAGNIGMQSHVFVGNRALSTDIQIETAAVDIRTF